MIAPRKLLARSDCAHAIANHADPQPAEMLRSAADWLSNGYGDRDFYGAGRTLNEFEAKIAVLLGKEAAVFMPSGTMAQQIALRIVADRRGLRTFAGHPTNHVVLHERDGFARLHDLAFIAVGSTTELMTLADVRAIREPVGTLLIELPQREIGGELPAWDDLVAVVDEAHSRDWHVHLDGARLWECGPAFGRPYAEIAALFDTVYVSFYKGIGALAGAMFLGSRAFVDEARIWQRRHGGNLFTLFPYSTIAEYAFDERIGRMPAYERAAKRVAHALTNYPLAGIRPAIPQTNMLHAFVFGSVAELENRAQRIAREHSIWTIWRLTPTAITDVQRWEISCGDATVALSDERLKTALDGLFAESAPVANAHLHGAAESF